MRAGKLFRRLAAHIPIVRRFTNPWYRHHPLDRGLGIDTGGFLARDRLCVDSEARSHASDFAPSAPSLVRQALAMLPEPWRLNFVDLGCGKGRACAVATEFPFRAVIGIELSPPLAAIARRNAKRIAARHKDRPEMRVIEGDALTAPLPDGDFAYYLYHPFDLTMVSELARRIEARPDGRDYLIYCNPVHAAAFDACDGLTRHFAGMIAHDREDHGFAPDRDDGLIIWRSRALGAAAPEAQRKTVIFKNGGWRAELI